MADRETTPTTKPVADAVEQLRALLAKEYGPDYAFVVLGKGHIIGASTLRHGIIVAEVHP